MYNCSSRKELCISVVLKLLSALFSPNRREALKMSLENKENKRKHRVCACGRKDHKNKKKKKYVNGGTSEG